MTERQPFAIRRRPPPYLHDGRLPTLDDAIEYFNLILNLRLTPQEKQDVVRYLYTL